LLGDAPVKIAFLRHGPTEWNVQGRIQGHTDIPLSAEGLQKMRGLRPDFKSSRIFVSPMQRARQTAEALGLKNPVFDTRLMEQNWGQWEGLTRDEILRRDGADAFAKAGLAGAFHPPGGESTQALHDRVGEFLGDAATEDGDALVVAHLGVLRAAYTLATGWDMATPMPPDLDVSKMLVLELHGSKRALHALNVGMIRV
jgi:broad specificity phosphatase PhoE